ncbi:phosphatase PAP2 family protein [Streptomyces sp. NRRL F-5123]|uniref:phosphatase PAP2 family protein n=1 Tax=Streptomyces sp. NRRL F-5123 TaxID=1463856 RepID=UPI0007C4DB2F|nr:phosphatase PAP2 family protein [Streptomyces sp. NRRL F-5123]
MRPSDSAAPRGSTSISRPEPEAGAAAPPVRPPEAPPGPAPQAPGGAGRPPLRADAPLPAAPDAQQPAAHPLPPGSGEAPAHPAAARPHLALVWSAGQDAPAGRARRVVRGAARADRRLLVALRAGARDPLAAAAVRVLGLAGEHGAVWLAAGAAGALADPERRAAWVRATAVVAGAHLASMGVKRVVRRPRPLVGEAPLVRTAGRHSFPSSHAASSAAAAVAFGPLLPGAATVPVLAAAICVSRLAAGVHYPSDVAGGALLGAVAARAGRAWVAGEGPDVPDALRDAARHVLPRITGILPGAAAAARALPQITRILPGAAGLGRRGGGRHG